MEIDTFAQCLGYLDLTRDKKSLLEALPPLVTTLIGVFIGFAINFIRDLKKDDKVLANKKMCIAEELTRTKLHLEHIFSEFLKIYDSTVANEIIPGHRLPSEIPTPFLNEHFISIAHHYTQDERDCIAELAPRIQEINDYLEAFKNQADAANFNQIGVISLNSISVTMHCYQIFEAPLKKDRRPKMTVIIELADRLGLTSAYIEKLRTKRKP